MINTTNKICIFCGAETDIPNFRRLCYGCYIRRHPDEKVRESYYKSYRRAELLEYLTQPKPEQIDKIIRQALAK